MRKRKSQRAPKAYIGKGVLFQLDHRWTVLRGGGAQQHTATAAALPVPDCTVLPATLGEMSAPPPLRHIQQQLLSQSVQAPNVNSSSLNNMFKVVATVFQQIMTELNGAESEEDRMVAIRKIVLKLMKQNGC
jgi:hypothetical protein